MIKKIKATNNTCQRFKNKTRNKLGLTRDDKRKLAFTLAETLITLLVIGVVAALTIPSLMQTYKERQTVTHLKKFYSTISNAVKRAEADENPIGNWEYCSGEGVNSDKFLAQLIKYLQVSKVCWNDDNTCSTDEAYITLDQSRTWNAGNPNWGGYSRAILSDGSLMFVCPSCGEDDDRYGEVNIDINGEKGPNRLGVDTFHFYILKDGAKVTPSYHGENLEESCNLNYYGNGDNGDGCAMWIIKKGNMNYLHKTVSWDD